MTQVSSVVLGWAHDPDWILELYDNPENFIPDRYLLTENGTKPGVDGSDLRPTFAFGVGRVSHTSVSGFNL
jgi:hypothetical protein